MNCISVATRANRLAWLPVAVLLVVCLGQTARAADGCIKTLDYILNNLAGELPRPTAAYQKQFQVCTQTRSIANIRDAYLLKDGGIAVIARDNSVFATATTLADFCRQFPHNTLHFISRREVRKGLTTGLIVMMESNSSTSCEKIMGKR
jgi:hypothetical protein